MTHIEYSYKKCPSCGIHYAVDKDVMDSKRNATKDSSNRNWYCPNGHNLVFSESEIDKQRQRAERAEQQIEHQRQRAESAERSISAHKGQITKLKNRAKNGVCPCCNRSFENLQRHMKSQHPKFDPKNPLQVIDGGKVA